MKIYSYNTKYLISSIFINNPILKNNNIIQTTDVNDCDIIVETDMQNILKNIHINKKFLLWTCEPYSCLYTKNVVTVKNKEVHIMNCYTGDVYMNNFYFFNCVNHNPHGLKFISKYRPKKTLNRRIVTLFTYDLSKKMKNTLRVIRTKIALDAHKKDMIDIYGQKWPAGISKGDSRATFISDKQKILKKYDFCLAFENCNSRYYVTEKIWHAISNFTLPIYYGNAWIYETFPQDSFIDYTKFKTNDELFDFIKNITIEEYNNRLLKCINVVKNNFHMIPLNVSRKLAYEAFVNKLNTII